MTGDRVLVTGANGFIGNQLCTHLAGQGREVIATVRPSSSPLGTKGAVPWRTAQINDLCDERRWSELLPGVDTVIHLAARVHVMNDRAADPLAEFRKVNVAGTKALAVQAQRAGVRRFVYLSSIKVNGEATKGKEFRADDLPGYLDPYGQSKWEAEQALREIATASGLEWVIVRPTLVYGPGVRGNFLSLLRMVDRGLPLPLGGSRNRRSLVSVYNLVDLLANVIDHPAAPGNTFLVKDAEDLSTSELVNRIGKAMHKRVRMLAVPPALLVLSARLLGQKKIAQRLLDSLVVNTEKTAEVLGWNAPMSLDCAMEKTCCWFQQVTSFAGRA